MVRNSWPTLNFSLMFPYTFYNLFWENLVFNNDVFSEVTGSLDCHNLLNWIIIKRLRKLVVNHTVEVYKHVQCTITTQTFDWFSMTAFWLLLFDWPIQILKGGEELIKHKCHDNWPPTKHLRIWLVETNRTNSQWKVVTKTPKTTKNPNEWQCYDLHCSIALILLAVILNSIDTSDFCQIQDPESPKARTTDKQGRCKDVPASDTKTSEAKQMLSLARQDGKQHSVYNGHSHTLYDLAYV